MEQSDTDWGDWSLNNEADIDEMIESYKEETMEEKPDSGYDASSGLAGEDDFVNDYRLYDNYNSPRNQSDSGESEESAEEGSELAKYFMNGQEGMATCENCGRLGVKHAFYSKSKRFCSLTCSRSYSSAQKDQNKRTNFQSQSKPIIGKKTKHSQKPKPQTNTIPSSYNKQNATRTFDWSEYLTSTQAQAAPVTCFHHCPMSDCWDNITMGMKVEVLNTDCDLTSQVYWIATVIKIAGYKALMRYEGFGNDPSCDFWINLCTQDVHPVGWCATIGKPLVPPKTIQEKYVDWKDFLVKRLTGARTLPNNFYNKVLENMNDHPIKSTMRVEVVNKMCVSAMRVATVDEIIGGRLRLRYIDAKDEHDDFWCHRRSALVHPVGWSQAVGHKLNASAEYRSSSYNKAATNNYSDIDTAPDMFPKVKEYSDDDMKFQIGMKLEAIDPLNLASICVATVMKVLRHNYLMIGIDGSMAENGSDWFCYHASSPCVFPVGFCEINGLFLTPPRGYKGQFKWFDYLKQTKSVAAPVKLFDKEIPNHGFKVGMKLEAVDLMEPRLICVGTVTKVVGRLLRIHFDGWESSYDQWIDCRSPDIYPVGWCEMVEYHLEGPRVKELQQQQQQQQQLQPAPLTPSLKKRKSKSQMYRGPRKKRKAKVLLPHERVRTLSQQSSIDTDDLSQDSCSQSAGTPETPVNQAKESHGESRVSVKKNGMQPETKENMPTSSTNGIRRQSSSSHITTPRIGNSFSQKIPVSLSSTLAQHLIKPTEKKISQASVYNFGSNSTLPKATVAVHLSQAKSLPTISTMLNSPIASAKIPVKTSTPTQSAAAMMNIKPPITQMAAVAIVSSTNNQGKQTTSVTNSESAMANTLLGKTLQSPTQLYAVQSPAHANIKRETAVTSGYTVQQVVTHHIPRVVPGETEKNSRVGKSHLISPELWSVYDVCHFLKINDCGAYCESFTKKIITGKKFMTLTKEQIVNLTGMKVGPSLKIYDLIQQLKIKVAQQQRQQNLSTVDGIVNSQGLSTSSAQQALQAKQATLRAHLTQKNPSHNLSLS